MWKGSKKKLHLLLLALNPNKLSIFTFIILVFLVKQYTQCYILVCFPSLWCCVGFKLAGVSILVRGAVKNRICIHLAFIPSFSEPLCVPSLHTSLPPFHVFKCLQRVWKRKGYASFSPHQTRSLYRYYLNSQYFSSVSTWNNLLLLS